MTTVGLVFPKAKEPEKIVFKCTVCGKEYKSKAALTKHQKTHNKG